MNLLNRVAMPGIFIFLNGFSILEIKLLNGFQSVHAPQPIWEEEGFYSASIPITKGEKGSSKKFLHNLVGGTYLEGYCGFHCGYFKSKTFMQCLSFCF